MPTRRTDCREIIYSNIYIYISSHVYVYIYIYQTHRYDIDTDTEKIVVVKHGTDTHEPRRTAQFSGRGLLHCTQYRSLSRTSFDLALRSLYRFSIYLPLNFSLFFLPNEKTTPAFLNLFFDSLLQNTNIPRKTHTRASSPLYPGESRIIFSCFL